MAAEIGDFIVGKNATANLGDASEYEIRTGSDGITGIYLRRYNVRVATFSAGSDHLQRCLMNFFDRATQGQVHNSPK